QAAGTGRPVAGTAGAGIAPRDPDTDGRTGPVGRRFARTPSGVGCDGVTWVVTSRYRPSWGGTPNPSQTSEVTGSAVSRIELSGREAKIRSNLATAASAAGSPPPAWTR